MKSSNSVHSYSLPLLLIFLAFSCAISAFGYRYYVMQKEKITWQKFQELSGVAKLKTEELAKWREERLSHAKSLQSNRHFLEHIAHFLRKPEDRELREEIQEWLTSFQTSFGYRSVALLDVNSAQRLIAGDQNVATGAVSRSLILAAKRSGEIQFADLHISEKFHIVHMDVLVPLFLPHESRQMLAGILQIVIDPSKRLYPLVQSWPTPSPSAETLLVRKEGDQVVFLNELRYRKGAALGTRFALSSTNLPAAMAVRGFEGTTQGIDYRGVPVFAAVKKVGGSPWFLVAKVDADEILKPVRDQAIISGLIVSFLVLLAGMGIGLFWRHGRARLYKRLYEEERRYHVLSDRIDALTRCAYDTILVLNSGLQIIEANEKAEEIYGYSRNELLKLHLHDILSPEEIPGIEERTREIILHNGASFESIHRHKDGTCFPVECSVSYLDTGGESFSQVIVRDIRERKAAQARIDRLNRMYATLSQVNQAIVKGSDRQAVFEEVCRVIVEKGGLRLAWIGLVDHAAGRIIPVAHFGFDNGYLDLLDMTLEDAPHGQCLCDRAVREGRYAVCQDAMSDPYIEPWRELVLSRGYLSGAAFPIRTNGSVIGVISSYSAEAWYFDDEILALFTELSFDVSYALDALQKKDELRQSEERYHQLFEHMTTGFATHELVFNEDGNPVDYRITNANPAFERLTGIPRDRAIGGLASQVYGVGSAPFLDIFADVALNIRSTVFDTHYPLLEKYFSIAAFSPVSGQFATLFSDITATKLAEIERVRNEARLQSLYDISQYRAESVQDLLDFSLAEALRLTASKFGYMYFYDEEKREFILNSWSNEVMKECAVVEPQTRYDLDRTGIWGETVRQRRPILVNDFQGCNPLKKGYPSGHVELFSYLTIPVFSGERIVAVIGVANKGGAYDETDIRQLTLLSDSVWKYVERKSAEEELVSLNQKLEQRVLERTADLESFTYSASHDLRAPLRAISGFSRIVLDEYSNVLDSEGHRLLHIIIDNTRRMGQLIDDLLAFSRAGRSSIHYSLVNMTALAEDVCAQLVTDEIREKINIRIDTLPSVRGDLALLRQVWVNLLSNAIKFTLPKGGGLIEFGGDSVEEEDRFHVKDTGVGFDMQHADKLFGIFQRLHSVSEYEGNGVGLAIVQRIVSCHGGRVWAESREGEGAMFSFSLPRNGVEL